MLERVAAAVGAGVAASALSAAAGAGPLGSESSIGIQSQYNSNPYLQPGNVRSAESEALVLNFPLTYSGDVQTIDLIPHFRFSENQGPEALLSNYEDVDADWLFKNERNQLSAAGFWHHDSTFYNQFENGFLGGHALDRTEESATVGWRRYFTERSDVQLAASDDRVRYDTTFATLTNYQYAQAYLQLEHFFSERWQWTLSAGYGAYRVTNYTFDSANRFAQTTIFRPLSEQWSFSAQVGYSYLSALQIVDTPYVFLCIIDNQLAECLGYTTEQQHYARGTPSYAATLEHKDERLALDLTASRSLQPSGVGAILSQEDASLRATYALTERWNVGGALHESTSTDTLGRLHFGDRRFYDADASANWQWTEHWLLTLQASFDLQRLNGQRTHNVVGSLTLSRQLGRVAF